MRQARPSIAPDVRANVDGKNPQPGLPLHLELTVGKIAGGALVPLPNAFIYIWHCSAEGVYSGEAGLNSGADTYLRGYQVTDAKGAAKFLTIYPGWYGGRTVHIHARIRLYPGDNPKKTPTYDYETQFFFDDAATAKIYKSVAPYNQRPDRDTFNADDHVYTGGSLDADGVTANAGNAGNHPSDRETRLRDRFFWRGAQSRAQGTDRRRAGTGRAGRPPAVSEAVAPRAPARPRPTSRTAGERGI